MHVAIAMWLLLAFATISGLAFWIGEHRRSIRERAYREVLVEKNLIRPGESVKDALSRIARKPISNRPKRVSGAPDSLRDRVARAAPPPPVFSSRALHREGNR